MPINESDLSGGNKPDSGPPDPDPDFVPAAPKAVRLSAVSPVTGQWTLSWADIRINGKQATQPLKYWQVVYVRNEAIQSFLASDPNWVNNVLHSGEARVLATISSSGSGYIMVYNHADLTLVDGYVLVVGTGVNGLLGAPSVPIRLSFATGTGQPLQGLQQTIIHLYRYKETQVGYPNTHRTRVVWFFIAKEQLTSRINQSNYAGVQLFMSGAWQGPAAGNIADGVGGVVYGNVPVPPIATPIKSALASGINYVLPEATFQLWAGTASFTNGGLNMGRVSGPAFNVGTMTNRRILAEYSAVGYDGDSGYDYFANPVLDGNNIQLNQTWKEASGTYSVIIPQATAWYFVAVSGTGTHVQNVTTAPGVLT
jgi:hypothetical protein